MSSAHSTQPVGTAVGTNKTAQPSHYIYIVPTVPTKYNNSVLHARPSYKDHPREIEHDHGSPTCTLCSSGNWELFAANGVVEPFVGSRRFGYRGNPLLVPNA
jgi:hypothetical protein